MDTDATRIAKGTMYIITQNILSYLISVVAFAFIARILTKTEMGVSVALGLILSMAGLLSDLGLGNGVRRYIAEYRGKKQDYTVSIQAGIVLKALTATLIAIIIVLAAPCISMILLKTWEYTFLFQLLGLDVICTCLNATLRNILWGLNRIRKMSILHILATFVRQMAVLVFLFNGWGLIGYLIGWTLGDLVYMIGTVSFLLNSSHLQMHSFQKLWKHALSLLKFSLSVFVNDAIGFLYNWFDKTVLLAFVSIAEVGVYNIASEAYSVLATFPEAFVVSLFPFYGEQYGGGHHQNITIGMQKASRYSALLYTPLTLGIGSTATYVMTIFAGEKYSSGGIILTILCLFSIIKIIVIGDLLLVYKKTFAILMISTVTVATSLALSFVLLPRLGIVGMAIIKGIAMVISLIMAIISLRNVIPIKIDKEAAWKSLCSGLVMVVIIIVFETNFPGGFFLPFYIAVGSITYLSMIKAMKALRVEDVKLTEEFLGGRYNSIVKVLEKLL